MAENKSTTKSREVPVEVRNALEALFRHTSEDYEKERRDYAKEKPGDEPVLLSPDIEDPAVKSLLPVLTDFLKRDDVFPSLDPDWLGPSTWSREQKIERMLEELCSWIGATAFYREPDAKPEVAAQRFFEGLNAPPQDVTYIPIVKPMFAPQLGTNCKITLGPQVTLVSLSSSLREFILWNANITSPANAHRLLGYFALEIVTPAGSERARLSDEVTWQINKLRIFLRAFFGASLYAPIQLYGRRPPWHPWQPQVGPIPREIDLERGSGYVDRHAFESLKRCCEAGDTNGLKRYALTVDRLDKAEQRDSPTDRIIDLAIALESFFNGEAELSYRYATNCAALLEDAPEKRIPIYFAIKDFYKVRSLVAHGKDPSNSSSGRAFGANRTEIDEKLKQLASIVEKLLRIHILNPDIRNDEGKTAQLLNPRRLISDPTAFGRPQETGNP